MTSSLTVVFFNLSHKHGCSHLPANDVKYEIEFKSQNVITTRMLFIAGHIYRGIMNILFNNLIRII